MTKGGGAPMYSPPTTQQPAVATSPRGPPASASGGAGSGIDYSDKQPTLRVMRLYKPRLNTRRVLPSCTVGVGRATKTGAAVAGGVLRPAGGLGVGVVEEGFALSSALKLPDSFGNIYLGEAFTAYISVLNHLPSTVLVNASLLAKLQSPSARVELEDMRMDRGASVARQNPASGLQPSENLDMIVEHTLEELGTHTLRVTVKYEIAGMPAGTEPLTMRKFYRFSVMNPVSMAAMCTAVRGQPFVEMQLRNTTQMDLLLESCDFIPEQGFVASLVGGGGALGVASGHQAHEDDQQQGSAGQVGRTKPWWHSGVYAAKNSSKQPEKGKKTMERAEAGMERNGSPSSLMTAVDRFDRGVLLCPEDTYQLVYSIGSLKKTVSGEEEGGGGGEGTAVDEGEFEEGVHTLGQVELCWRTTMGESGSVLSAPVVFEASDRREVEVTVDGLPEVLQLGRVANCVASVHNRSRRSMTLQLQFRTDNMVGVYVHGQSFRNLGELQPGMSTRCPLQLLALVAGLHELRGCSVVDMQTAQEFPQGKLRNVLVEFPDNGDGDDSDPEGHEEGAERIVIVRGDSVL